MKKLIIAGIGIKYLSHMTVEVKVAIETSDCVVYLVNEPASKKWIEDNSKKAVSLDSVYFSSLSRVDTYVAINNEILRLASMYETTCFVTYGHPFFLSSSALSVAKYLSDNTNDTSVVAIPGISSLDCLYCDLQIDPGEVGIQAYEATDFILYKHAVNASAPLVLCQIGVAGIVSVISNDEDIDSENRRKALSFIQEKLMLIYDSSHSVYLYVASQYPSVAPEVKKIKLSQLASEHIDRLATAYIPPSEERVRNEEVYNKLFVSL